MPTPEITAKMMKVNTCPTGVVVFSVNLVKPFFSTPPLKTDLEQQQQPCASSRPRSGRVKQQQQSILLAAVRRAFNARHGRNTVSWKV
mmetsp:Transcript_35104/g.75814  ORF Transcript_35104/g.75814 Transcript_35104/m.75814 type:complete len:88 (+) Transcript_35104:623-886(+)